jgi:hypothetical protein
MGITSAVFVISAKLDLPRCLNPLGNMFTWLSGLAFDNFFLVYPEYVDVYVNAVEQGAGNFSSVAVYCCRQA